MGAQRESRLNLDVPYCINQALLDRIWLAKFGPNISNQADALLDAGHLTSGTAGILSLQIPPSREDVPTQTSSSCHARFQNLTLCGFSIRNRVGGNSELT